MDHLKLQFVCIILISFMWMYCSSRNYESFTKPHNCKAYQYFDTISMSCSSCPQNQTSINYYSCECKLGFIPEFKNKTKRCLKCPENYIKSDDGMFCVKCDSLLIYNATTLSCDGCLNNSNTILQDMNLNNSYLGSKSCAFCPDHLIANKERNQCITCHPSFYLESDRVCSCPSESHDIVGGICISKVDFALIPITKSSYLVHYEYGEDSSLLFENLFRVSAFTCVYHQNVTGCQIISNLCVLLHYNFDNELSACGFYRASFGSREIDLPNHVPWLYYSRHKARDILMDTSFSGKFSFQESPDSNHKLEMIVARYSIEGQLLSYEPFLNIQHLCPETIIEVQQGLRFGQAFQSSCTFDVDHFVNEMKTEFYDLYLRYSDSGEKKLYPIPLLVQNYRFDNTLVNNLAMDKWQLMRRFFFLDKSSGQRKDDEETSLEVIRYLQSMEIVVQLQMDSLDGYIYPPYVKLNYKELTKSQMKHTKQIEFLFQVNYITNFDYTRHIITILLSLLCSVATLGSILKTWNWCKRCGRVDVEVIFHWISLECGYLANMFFLVLFVICFFWFVIFKNQDVVWVFLPDEQQEFLIKQFLISAFSLKILPIIYVLYNQISCDLFIIDWEQPKIQTSVGGRNQSDKKEVSIWRTYFIANQWNELQTHRKISLPLTLFILVFIMKVLNYENITRHYPSAEDLSINEATTAAPFSFVSRFALSVSLFVLICILQSIFMTTFYERFIENKVQMFIDLCSMANVSVLILKHRLYGYYIHGRSVNGEADLGLQSFYDQLKREEEDLCGRRGLEPSSECQTFEVLLTNKFRLKYDSILADDDPRDFVRRASDDLKIAHCIKAHEKMKRFLTIFLQHAHKGLDFIVKDKLFLETALDVEFQEPKNASLFFRDYRHTFDKVLLYGEEMLFLSFEMMTFTFIDLLSNDFLLSSCVTFIIHEMISVVRYQGGKRNMVSKTLVDKRFLI